MSMRPRIELKFLPEASVAALKDVRVTAPNIAVLVSKNKLNLLDTFVLPDAKKKLTEKDWLNLFLYFVIIFNSNSFTILSSVYYTVHLMVAAPEHLSPNWDRPQIRCYPRKLLLYY